MQELKAGKVPVCLRKDYKMYLEFFDNNLWFHTDILKWSADTKRQYAKDVNQLLDLVGHQIVALIREDDIKLKKFAETFGWTEQCQINLLDGSRAYIYVSRRDKGE